MKTAIMKYDTCRLQTSSVESAIMFEIQPIKTLTEKN